MATEHLRPAHGGEVGCVGPLAVTVHRVGGDAGLVAVGVVVWEGRVLLGVPVYLTATEASNKGVPRVFDSSQFV